MFNNFTARFRLCKEPVFHEANGTKVCRANTVNSQSRKVDGEWEESPMYVVLVAFGANAERLKALGKGDEVLTSGTLTMKSFTRKDGTTGQQLEMSCNGIMDICRKGEAAKGAESKSDESEDDLPL